jgi:hypothetical protein
VLGKITFSSWATEWRRGIVDLQPSTLARDDGYLKRYLTPALGDKQLAEIDHAELHQQPRASPGDCG